MKARSFEVLASRPDWPSPRRATLEWNEERLSLRHDAGPLLEVPLARAHEHVDVLALYVDLDLELLTPAGTITLAKHRQAALAVQQLVEAAIAVDPTFREVLRTRAAAARRRGLVLMAACLAPMLVYGLATSVLGSPRQSIDDAAHLVLAVPFIGFLAGLIALHHGWSQLRLVRRLGGGLRPPTDRGR